MTTAGHCGNTESWVSFGGATTVAMAFKREVRSAYADLQYHTMPVMYNMFFGGSNQTATVRSGVSTSRASTAGKYLCHRGQTSGASCGTVGSITDHWGGYGPTCDATHPCASVWVSMTGTYLHCQGGDSGGPVYAGGTAYGSLTYCAGDHKAGFMHTDYFGDLGFVFY